MSNLNTPLGGNWDTRPPDDLPAQLEADRQASHAASAGTFGWASLDDGVKDYSNAKSGQIHGQGCNLTGWMYRSKQYSTVDSFSFKGANWQRGNGGGLVYENTDFSGAKLDATDFTGSEFLNCTFDANTSFAGCNLKQARFTGTSGESARLASYQDAEFGHFVFEKGADGRNTIGLDAIPPGARLISDEVKRQQLGVDLYATN